ncbi:Fic family protein [Sphingobium cloacae]|uniref:Fic family protein n=1 Tax=Sphingobium cloacae TaxID=120107 RepID=A0A1E1F734_9SPHN|nr:Fic family protein [Sphingobium cloacae]
METDIRQTLVAYMAEGADDSVQERLAPDEAVIRQHVGAIRHMLSRAEADFEVERAIMAEQTFRSDFPFFGNGKNGEEAIHQFLLARAELVAGLPPVEAVEGRGVTGFMRGHGGPIAGGEAGSKREKDNPCLPPSGCVT